MFGMYVRPDDSFDEPKYRVFDAANRGSTATSGVGVHCRRRRRGSAAADVLVVLLLAVCEYEDTYHCVSLCGVARLACESWIGR